MKAAVYARFSSDNQRAESIDAQLREITEYANKNNISIVKVYADEAKSAKTDDRPEFQKMLRDAEHQLFDVVLIHKLDRFARNRYDSAVYKRKLKSLGISVISIKEKLDDSPESIILEAMLEGMAEYYSENLAREVMKGMKENALKCKHTGGKPPFGFDVNDKLNYVINEREAIAVEKIFNDYASGKSYRDIITWLNAGGYTTKYGKPFQQTSINTILKNEKYIGRYTFNKFKRVKRNGILVNEKHSDDEVIVIDKGIPSIIGEEVFYKVKNQMLENKANMRSVSAKERYLLSGLLYCGLCGCKMNGARRLAGRNKSIYITYQCSNRKTNKGCNKKELNRDLIEHIVIEHLENNIFTAEFINETANKMHKRYLETESTCTNNIKVYEEELRKVVKQIENIVDAVANGLYHESMKEKMDVLEKQKSEYTFRLTEERAKLNSKFTLENMITFLEQGRGVSQKSFREQKILIKTFVSKIEAYEDEVILHLRIRGDGLDGGSNKSSTIDSDVPVVHDAPPP